MSLRILFVSHYALPHLGGIEVVVDALARELVTRGHRVVHVAGTAHGGAVGREPSGYEVVRVPALNGLESRLGVPWPVFARACSRACDARSPPPTWSTPTGCST